MARTKTIDEPLRIDLVARELMGTEQDGCFEALLAANPGLADQGAFARAPQKLVAPDAPAKPAAPVVNPWD